MSEKRVFNFNGANVTFNDIHDNHNCTIIVPQQGKNAATNASIPEELSTEEAKQLLSKLQQADLLDANYQPCSNHTKTYYALVAKEVSNHLGLEKCWAPFEELWSRKNMRNDYQRALESKTSGKYIEEIHAILA